MKRLMICAPRFCIICVLGAFLYGCATATTPNSPYRGPGYPSNFSHLALRNPLLAMELGKIPELTDGISVKEKKALATIAKIYQEEPIGFDSAFTRLYKIGLPEVRKYCSPLQAIFWLAEDGELDKEFIHYSLRELLDKSWKFGDTEYSRWKSFDVVTDRLNAPELIDYYERKRFHYVDWRSLPLPWVPPRYVFKHNKGECVSITRFTVYCLRKAGYKAREIHVPDPVGRYPFHAICLFEMNGGEYVMDNGRPGPLGIHPYEKDQKR